MGQISQENGSWTSSGLQEAKEAIGPLLYHSFCKSKVQKSRYTFSQVEWHRRSKNIIIKIVAVVTEVLFKKNERVLTAFNVYLRNYLNNLMCATHQKHSRSWVQEEEEGGSELRR